MPAEVKEAELRALGLQPRHLRQLKSRQLSINELWVEAGRPPHGFVFRGTCPRVYLRSDAEVGVSLCTQAQLTVQHSCPVSCRLSPSALKSPPQSRARARAVPPSEA